MKTLSIYNAHRLKLCEDDPLFRILFYAEDEAIQLAEREVAR